MAFQTPITVRDALDAVQRHDYALPAIQREFVWSAEQICMLFDSLLRGYPIGSFLFWKVAPENCAGRSTVVSTICPVLACPDPF